MSDNDDKAKIAALEKRIAELELKTQPPPKVQVARPLEGIPPTARLAIDQMSVPQHILREMQAAVPDEVVRQIAKDGRK